MPYIWLWYDYINLFFISSIGNIILSSLLILFMVDFIIAVLGIMNIKKRILLLNDIAYELRVCSNNIGENIYKSMTVAIKTKDMINHKLEDSKSGLKTNIDEKKKYIANLKIKYETILKEKNFVHRRLEKAFPNLEKKLSNSDS